LTAKFNNKKLPLPWSSGPLELGGLGQWPVWPVVKTALVQRGCIQTSSPRSSDVAQCKRQ